jgi:hypothetical protein
MPSTNDTPTSLGAQGEGLDGRPANFRVADILCTQLEVKLSMSNTMDLLWCILLGMLSLLVGILGVALAVAGNRVQWHRLRVFFSLWLPYIVSPERRVVD